MSRPVSDTVPMNPPSDASSHAPPGLCLRAAREAAGMSLDEAARRLKLRAPMLDAIEREDVAALGAPVFARGYAISYARLLHVPEQIVDRLFPREAVVEAVPLQTAARGSHGRHLLDRYARRFVYVALTAAIVVPVVLLATRDHLPDPETLLTPLDAPLTDVVSNDPSRIALPLQREDVGPPAPVEQPIMASLTPFYSTPRAAAPDAAATGGVAAAPVGLVLELTGTSWVEVIGHDGTRLAHELLRDGSQRTFAVDRVARVLLGNAEAVKVRVDGREVDTTPYRRANVARFELSSDGSLASGGE